LNFEQAATPHMLLLVAVVRDSDAINALEAVTVASVVLVPR
jgi:hypothetical protein